MERKWDASLIFQRGISPRCHRNTREGKMLDTTVENRGGRDVMSMSSSALPCQVKPPGVVISVRGARCEVM